MSANYDLAELSHEFLTAVKRDAKIDNYRSTLAALNESDLADLEEDVATAFWVNLYNAFVQIDLKQDPSLYERKRQFFGEDRIDIAGKELSLDDIEHGILRSSKWKYGLGYIPRLFPSDFERRHRLSRVDPRIHFALNCGAKSCPPIVAYTATDIGSELETSTRSFLQQSSTYDTEDNELKVTRLFLYYRGDFGGRSGIYEVLERYDVIEDGARPRIRYEPYDWTVHKGMYRE